MKKNSLKVDYSRQFEKQLQKAPLQIKKAFRHRREIFEREPHHALLRNHALKGMYQGYRSINITGDWRSIFIEEENPSERHVIFIALGTHSQLYKK